MTVKQEKYADDDGVLEYAKVTRLWSRFDPEKGYKFYYNRGSVESAKNIPYPDSSLVTDDELGKLQRISRYMVGDSNFLGYRGNNNRLRPMSVEKIASALRISRSAGYRFIKRMIDAGMINRADIKSKYGKETHYYMNPLYYSSSDYIPLNLYLLFREQIDAYLPKWAIEKYRLMEVLPDPDK